jgi:transcriptional regulator GlxA family with amidase domain
MSQEHRAASPFRIAIPDKDIEAVDMFVQSKLINQRLDQRVRKALELLLQDSCAYGGSITIRHILGIVNMSASRFRHLFKAETGVSPTRLLKVRRLCRARHLLQTTFLSVKQIAASLGVNDMSHFVNDYHAAFGESPTQTRRGRQFIVAQQESPSNSHSSQYI